MEVLCMVTLVIRYNCTTPTSQTTQQLSAEEVCIARKAPFILKTALSPETLRVVKAAEYISSKGPSIYIVQRYARISRQHRQPQAMVAVVC